MCKNCHKGSCCVLAMIAKVLVVIGGINWGLVGLSMLLGKTGVETWNVVRMLFGTIPVLEAVVYVLVGVAAVILACGCKCRKCSVEGICSSCADCAKTDASKIEETA